MSDLGVLELRAACTVGSRFLKDLERALCDLARDDLTRCEAEQATDQYVEAKAYLRVLLGSEIDLTEVEKNITTRIAAAR